VEMLTLIGGLCCVAYINCTGAVACIYCIYYFVVILIVCNMCKF
jgi:hypothetical protein